MSTRSPPPTPTATPPTTVTFRGPTPQAEQRGGTFEFPVVLGTGTVESLKRPARDATRDRWVAYAKLLDPDLTDEDLKPITVAGMREMTALQDGTAEADA
jgi:hypothetical protein